MERELGYFSVLPLPYDCLLFPFTSWNPSSGRISPRPRDSHSPFPNEPSSGIRRRIVEVSFLSSNAMALSHWRRRRKASFSSENSSVPVPILQSPGEYDASVRRKPEKAATLETKFRRLMRMPSRFLHAGYDDQSTPDQLEHPYPVETNPSGSDTLQRSTDEGRLSAREGIDSFKTAVASPEHRGHPRSETNADDIIVFEIQNNVKL